MVFSLNGTGKCIGMHIIYLSFFLMFVSDIKCIPRCYSYYTAKSQVFESSYFVEKIITKEKACMNYFTLFQNRKIPLV